MAEQLKNLAETVLAESLDASETTITVSDGSVFPASGTFRVVVDDELMTVTARSTNDLTVTRGAEGTTAATHDLGAPIVGVLTAAGLAAAMLDTSPAPRGTSFPGSPSDGQPFYRTDVRGGMLFRYKSSLSRWLSDQEFSIGFGSGGPYAASFTFFQSIPHDYPIHLTRVDYSFFGASESWSVKLRTGDWDETYTDVTGSSQSTAAHTDSRWYGYSAALDYAIDGTLGNGNNANIATLALDATRTSGTTYIHATAAYRLSLAP